MKLFAIAVLLLSAFLQDAAEEKAPSEDSKPAYRTLTTEEKDAFLEKMTETLARIQTLRADFVQERHIVFFGEPLTASGVCYFRSPDTLRWEIEKPYVSILILVDRKIAKFDVVDGKLRKMNPGAADLLREVLGQIVDWIKGDFARAEELYELEFQKAESYRVVMRPRSGELREVIVAVELTIDPATFRATSVVIREPGEDYLEIRFSNEELDEPLGQALFDLEEPSRPSRED